MISLTLESGLRVLYNSCPDCVTYKSGTLIEQDDVKYAVKKFGDLSYFIREDDQNLERSRSCDSILQVEVKKKMMDYNKRFDQLFPIWAQAVLGLPQLSIIIHHS